MDTTPNPVQNLPSVTQDTRRVSRMALEHPRWFGALMVLAMFAFKIALMPLMLLVSGGDEKALAGTTEAVTAGGLGLVLLSFLFLPVETILGQQAPVWLFRKLGVRRWTTICVLAATVFGLLHLPMGPAAFLVGIAGGIPLTLCWLAWREQSFKQAFVRTTLVHVVHNVFALVVFATAELGSG